MDILQLDRLIYSGKPIHLTGIGGVSMRALAELLLARGAAVQGSDRAPGPHTERLAGLGACLFAGHDARYVENAVAVIRTAAVPDANPEIARARELGIPVLERAEAWGMIMAGYESAVCVAGTHGKTTTTSMIATFTAGCGLDPTVMVGGDLASIGGGSLRIGQSGLMVAEACEYKNSFLMFHPTVAVILNIDRDHLDFFSDTDDIIGSFGRFARLVPEDTGTVIYNADDANTVRAVTGIDRRTLSFGMTAAADVYACGCVQDGGFYSFDVMYRGLPYGRVRLAVPGLYNVANALAAAAVAIALGVPPASFASGIAAYRGVSRRFEYKGELNGARVFDDYAHHPSEIAVSLQAARAMCTGRVICVFQPHTYSRTVSMLGEFAEALSHADLCVLTEIFAAREENVYGISSRQIAERCKNAVCAPDFEGAAAIVRQNARAGDVVFTMGAGNVYQVCELLLPAMPKEA